MLLEAVIVVLAAAAFGFAANELSPRGLRLSRNYFPNPSPSLPNLAQRPSNVAPTNMAAVEAETDQRLKKEGIQSIHRAETERLFHDQRYLQGLVVFVDAREQDPYADGHIPGAYRFGPVLPGEGNRQCPASLPGRQPSCGLLQRR